MKTGKVGIFLLAKKIKSLPKAHVPEGFFIFKIEYYTCIKSFSFASMRLSTFFTKSLIMF